MVKKTIEFSCPVCSDGSKTKVAAEEDDIVSAKRHPTIVTAKCRRNHQVLLFVMKDMRVVDVQSAVGVKDDDAVEKTRSYFESF